MSSFIYVVNQGVLEVKEIAQTVQTAQSNQTVVITGVDTRTQQIQTTVNGINTVVNANYGAIGTIDTRTTNIANRLATVDGNASTIKTDLATLRDSELPAVQTALQASITEVKGILQNPTSDAATLLYGDVERLAALCSATSQSAFNSAVSADVTKSRGVITSPMGGRLLMDSAARKYIFSNPSLAGYAPTRALLENFYQLFVPDMVTIANGGFYIAGNLSNAWQLFYPAFTSYLQPSAGHYIDIGFPRPVALNELRMMHYQNNSNTWGTGCTLNYSDDGLNFSGSYSYSWTAAMDCSVNFGLTNGLHKYWRINFTSFSNSYSRLKQLKLSALY